MSALMVATITVKDPADFSAYLEKSKAIASRFGAQMKFRGKKVRELVGDPVEGNLLIMVDFPSAEAINGWIHLNMQRSSPCAKQVQFRFSLLTKRPPSDRFSGLHRPLPGKSSWVAKRNCPAIRPLQRCGPHPLLVGSNRSGHTQVLAGNPLSRIPDQIEHTCGDIARRSEPSGG